jgi:hypothetical protein
MFNEIDNLEGLNLLKEEEQTELKDLFSNFKATYNPSNRFDVQFALKTSLKRSLVYKTDLMESTSAMEKKKQKHFEGDTKDKIKIVIATNTIQENSQDESSVDMRNGTNSVTETEKNLTKENSLVHESDLMESTSALKNEKQKHFEGDTKDKIEIVIATNTIQENSQDESSVDIRNGINSVIEKKLPASPIKADIMNYELKISKSNNTKCLNCKKPKSTIAKVR